MGDLARYGSLFLFPKLRHLILAMVCATPLACSSAQQTSKESRRDKSDDASASESSGSTDQSKSKGGSVVLSPSPTISSGSAPSPNTPTPKPAVAPPPTAPGPSAPSTPQAQGAAAFLCKPPINGQALALIQAVKGKDLNSLGVPLDETQKQMLEMLQNIDPSNQAAVQIVQSELDAACPK